MTFIRAVLAAYVLSGAFAGYVQTAWSGWFFVGHSLTLWVGVSLVAASRGTFLQAAAVTCGGLAAAVIAYFLTTFIFPGDGLAGLFYVPYVVLWVAAALPAGLLIASASWFAYQRRPFAGIGVGVLVGLLAGDVIVTEAGLPGSRGDLLQLVHITLHNADALVYLGFGGATAYLAWMSWFHRARLQHLLTAVPGAALGVILSAAPVVLHSL